MKRYLLADVALVMLRQLDVILDLLVRHDAADKQEIQPLLGLQGFFERRASRRVGDAARVDRNREHPGIGEAELLELLPVALRIAEGHVGVAGEGFQVFAAQQRQPEDRRVVAGEEMRRRHVVILEHAAGRQPRKGRGHRRDQREMKDGEIAACRAGIGPRDHVAAQIVVDRHGVEIGFVCPARATIPDAPAPNRRWRRLCEPPVPTD